MPIGVSSPSDDVSVRPKSEGGRLIAACSSATPEGRPLERAPVAGAPGWYVVRRTVPVVSGYPMRWLRHFRFTVVAVTVGVVLLVLPMVQAHWSEEVTRVTGIREADTKLRDEVQVLEEANALLGTELTQASTRQLELEAARKFADTRTAELTAALDTAHRESARREEALAQLRRQNAQLNQSVTRARAARDTAVAEAEKARAEMTEKQGALTGGAPRSNAELASLRGELEANRQELATIIHARDQLEKRLIKMKAAAERAEAETERLRTELAAARAEIERIKRAKTGLEQEIAALHLHSRLATEAARQNLIVMTEKIAALNAALVSAGIKAAAPPRSTEARRDLVTDQPAIAPPAPAAPPEQPAPEPGSDANAGQIPDSGASGERVVAMRAASSPGAEVATRSMLGSNPPIEESGRSQDTLATAMLQARQDPVLPDEFALLPLESFKVSDRLTAERQSRRPVADAPSMSRPQSAKGASPSLAQKYRTVAIQPSRWPPPVEADLGILGPAAKLHAGSVVSASNDHSAVPAGDIWIFIHHLADHQGDITLAQRLADYLRAEGFIVADIRPVEFSIGKPSVRYFYARDRAASQRLVEELRRFIESGRSLAPEHASDFTHYLPKPRPGNVEVWIRTL
jgi:hypothetical protein